MRDLRKPASLKSIEWDIKAFVSVDPWPELSFEASLHLSKRYNISNNYASSIISLKLQFERLLNLTFIA